MRRRTAKQKHQKAVLIGAGAVVLLLTIGVAWWTAVEAPRQDAADSRGVAGQILDKDGKPVLGAYVFLVSDDGSETVRAIADPDGRFVFSSVAGTRAGRVLAWAPGYLVGEEPEESTNTVVRLQPDTSNVTLELRFTMPAGEAAAGARVKLHRISETGESGKGPAATTRAFIKRHRIGATVDQPLEVPANGRVFFYSIKPGSFYVLGRYRDHAADASVTASDKNTVAEIPFRLGRLITFKSKQGPGSWKLWSGMKGREIGAIPWPDPIVTEEGGVFRIDGLPWDAFALEYTARGSKSTRVSFPAGDPERGPRDFDLGDIADR